MGPASRAYIRRRRHSLLPGSTARRFSLAGSAALFSVVLAGCSAASNDAASPPPPAAQSAAAALGERIFHDPALSASGRQSCAGKYDAFLAGRAQFSAQVLHGLADGFEP
jgi:cytochrome c peroxidase